MILGYTVILDYDILDLYWFASLMHRDYIIIDGAGARRFERTIYMAQRVVSPFSTGRPFSTEPSSMYLNMHAKTIRVQLFSAQVSSVVDIACSEDLFHWSSHSPTQPETSWLNHMIQTCKQHLSRRNAQVHKRHATMERSPLPSGGSPVDMLEYQKLI